METKVDPDKEFRGDFGSLRDPDNSDDNNPCSLLPMQGLLRLGLKRSLPLDVLSILPESFGGEGSGSLQSQLLRPSQLLLIFY